MFIADRPDPLIDFLTWLCLHIKEMCSLSSCLDCIVRHIFEVYFVFILFRHCQVARQLSVQIEPENLYLPSPLTHVGEFEVPLRLPKSIPLPEGKVRWTLKVKIRCK